MMFFVVAVVMYIDAGFSTEGTASDIVLYEAYTTSSISIISSSTIPIGGVTDHDSEEDGDRTVYEVTTEHLECVMRSFCEQNAGIGQNGIRPIFILWRFNSRATEF